MTVDIPITVDTSASALAFTGADVALTSTLGVAALGFGAFLVLVARRKRQLS
jgi:hypothetical protein